MGKLLIVYFSRPGENYVSGEYKYIDVGRTEIVVNMLTNMVDADVIKLEMTTPYSDDYKTCIAEAKAHLKNNARPELVYLPSTIYSYNRVIVAFPNYWGTIPMPVATFLEKYSWTGKSVYPICTHEGSGMGTSERMILKLCKGATIHRGLPLTGSKVESCQSTLEAWLKKYNLV